MGKKDTKLKHVHRKMKQLTLRKNRRGQESQVSEEGQEGTGGFQQVDQVGEGEQEETGGVQQVGQVSDIDMEGDEEVLKVPHLKRKTRSNSGSSKAKKTVKKEGRGAAESASDFRTGSQKKHKRLQCGEDKGVSPENKEYERIKNRRLFL